MSSWLRTGVIACVLLLVGCRESPLESEPPVDPLPTHLTPVAGEGQEGGIATPLAEPLVVRVTNDQGEGVPNVEVHFRVRDGDGVISPEVALSDAEGLARAEWVLGLPGDQIAEASVEGLTGSPAVFRASAVERRIPAQAVHELAREVYARLDTGDALRGVVADILDTLLPVIGPEATADSINALIGDGLPLVIEPQIEAIARGYESGVFVTLDSFVEAMRDLGVASRVAGAPLTLPHLTSALEGLAQAAEYAETDLVLAVIVQLGRERARLSSGGITNPVWGDSVLDPLQFTLLLYAVLLSGEELGDVVPGTASGALVTTSNWREQLRSGLRRTGELARVIRRVTRGLLGGALGVPLAPDDAIAIALCASVVLYSYDMAFDNEHDLLFRRWPEDPDARAFRTQATATLSFRFDARSVAADIVVRGACAFAGIRIPENGGVGGVRVQWSADGALPAHGALEIIDETTDTYGRTRATYVTVDETVPRSLRTGMPRSAAGRIAAQARSLLGWDARTLEAIVTETRGIGGAARAITVNYYEARELQLGMQSQASFRNGGDGIRGYDVSLATTGADGVIVLQPGDTANLFTGEGLWAVTAASVLPAECQGTIHSFRPGTLQVRAEYHPEADEYTVWLFSNDLPTETLTATCPEGTASADGHLGFAAWGTAHLSRIQGIGWMRFEGLRFASSEESSTRKRFEDSYADAVEQAWATTTMELRRESP